MDWPALNYDPVYSPDGSELAFASNITGDYAIYRQRLADGKSWRVTHGPGRRALPRLPALQPSGPLRRGRPTVAAGDAPPAAPCRPRTPPCARRACPAAPGRPVASTGTKTMLPGIG